MFTSSPHVSCRRLKNQSFQPPFFPDLCNACECEVAFAVTRHFNYLSYLLTFWTITTELSLRKLRTPSSIATDSRRQRSFFFCCCQRYSVFVIKHTAQGRLPSRPRCLDWWCLSTLRSLDRDRRCWVERAPAQSGRASRTGRNRRWRTRVSWRPFRRTAPARNKITIVISGGVRGGPSRLRPPPFWRQTDAVTHGHVS